MYDEMIRSGYPFYETFYISTKMRRTDLYCMLGTIKQTNSTDHLGTNLL